MPQQDFYATTDENTTLQDIDPLFAKPTTSANSPIVAAPAPVPESAPAAITPGDAAAIGAGVGAVAGRIPIAKPSSPAISNAQANAAAAQANVKSLQQTAQRAQTSQVGTVDSAFRNLQGAQAQYNQAQSALDTARQGATKTGVPLSVPSIQPGELLPGDKWAGKVTGSMGPGGDAVTEAARNYRLQQSLTPEEAAKFKVSRGALIVPNEVSGVGPYYNPQQLTQQQHLSQAQAAFDMAQKELNTAQQSYDKLARTGRASNAANALEAAERKAAAAAARVASLEGTTPGTASKAGRMISKIPLINTLSGAMAGYDAQQAIESFRKGDYVDAAMSGMGAAGGTLMMAPNLRAKAVGAAMSVPPMAYEAYKYFNPKQDEQPTKP